MRFYWVTCTLLLTHPAPRYAPRFTRLDWCRRIASATSSRLCSTCLLGLRLCQRQKREVTSATRRCTTGIALSMLGRPTSAVRLAHLPAPYIGSTYVGTHATPTSSRCLTSCGRCFGSNSLTLCPEGQAEVSVKVYIFMDI
jgi:hypothetical protein